MKIAIVVNLTKEKAIDCARKIAEIFQNAGADVILPPDCTEVLSDCGAVFAESIEQLFEIAEIAVTVGGDGTIIHAAKYAAVTNTPLIGVNVGRMGFAADVELNDTRGTFHGYDDVLEARVVRKNIERRTSFLRERFGACRP